MWKYKTSLLQVLQNQSCEKEDEELQVPPCVHSDVAESSKLGLQRLAAFPVDRDPVQGPRHSVIARGKDEDVEFVLSIPGLDTGGRDALDRGLAHINQEDIVLVVHFIIAALTGEAL